MPIIGNGLGPGGRGKDEVDLRRVTIYTPSSSPIMAVYVAECMVIEIERINHLVDEILCRCVTTTYVDPSKRTPNYAHPIINYVQYSWLLVTSALRDFPGMGQRFRAPLLYFTYTLSPE